MIRFFFSFSENVSNSTFLIRRKRHSSPLRHVYRFPGSPSTTREMKKNPATLPFQQQQPPPSSFVFSFILFLFLNFFLEAEGKKEECDRISISINCIEEAAAAK
jgi:hypothetical protein